MAQPVEKELQSTFRALAEAYRMPLLRLCMGYEHDPARSEELHQEILLALFRALPTFRHESSERTFVFRVAHNVAATHVRTAMRRHREAVANPQEVADPAPDAESRMHHRDQMRDLLEAVRVLPTMDRQIVMLFLEELPQREIAEVTGLSPSNVSTRLHRAKKALHAKLKGSIDD